MAARDVREEPAPVVPAFEEALTGARGWGLTRGDIVVIVATVLVAAAAWLVLWLGYGVGGAPGVSGDAPAAGGDATSANGNEAGAVGGDAAGGSAAPGGGTVGVDAGAVPAGASGPVAVIQNKEGFYQVVPLSDDAEVTVQGELGTNTFEVRDGRIRCSVSDCSNQVCADTGWVGSVGEMIVCLPHELTVQVVADASDAVPLV